MTNVANWKIAIEIVFFLLNMVIFYVYVSLPEGSCLVSKLGRAVAEVFNLTPEELLGEARATSVGPNHSLIQLIGLTEKITEKKQYFMGKSVVSCRFSQKSNHSWTHFPDINVHDCTRTCVDYSWTL